MTSRFGMPSVVRIPLLTVAAYLAFIILRLGLHGWDPSLFIVAGDRYTVPGPANGFVRVLAGNDGYDGQFYFRFALDPFTARINARGITLDEPSYRHQRILYPLTVWALSLGGHPKLVPILMIMVNLLSLFTIGWLGGRFARAMGHDERWGLLLPFYPGFLLSLSRDTAEIMAAALVLSGLMLVRREKLPAAACCLSLAVLARETALVAAGGFLLDWALTLLRRKRPPPGLALCWTIPLAVYIVWQVTLGLTWGELPLMAGRGNLVGFMAGVGGMTGRLMASRTLFDLFRLLEYALLAVFGLVTVSALSKSRLERPIKLAWCLALVLPIFLSVDIWYNDLAFLRAVSEFVFLGILVLLGLPGRAGLPARAVQTGFLLLWMAEFVFRSVRI